jgi:hypothetical protein
MKRATIGVLCVAVCLLTLLEGKRTRRALSTLALEQVERVFNAVEHAVHPA